VVIDNYAVTEVLSKLTFS